jgi:hypothetical protein
MRRKKKGSAQSKLMQPDIYSRKKGTDLVLMLKNPTR